MLMVPVSSRSREKSGDCRVVAAGRRRSGAVPRVASRHVRILLPAAALATSVAAASIWAGSAQGAL